MSAGNPPPGISHERLNQIASQKLAALSIAVRPGSDGKTLEGELLLKTSQVLYPGTEQPLPRARFVVRGHDHLRFLEPPLTALGEVMFYDLERPAALEERVAQLLRDRLVALEKVGAEMRRLKLPVRLDSQRLALKAMVKSGQHSFELSGVPGEVRVVRVELQGGPAFEVSPEHPPLRLAEFPSLVDLELFLSADVGRMRQRPAAASAPADRIEVQLEPVPPPAGQLTLGLLVQRFGPNAVISEESELDIIQEFQVGSNRYRFTASRADVMTFRGRVITASGGRWAELFELSRFPGAARIVASVARSEATVTPSAPISAVPATPEAQGAGAASPQPAQPQPGQVWVMSVLIEQETLDEIRYVCTGIDGKPYGAARVLKRADFEATFLRHGAQWQLLIRIDEVQADHIVYRQLDAQRQARGQPRRLITGALIATFLPEKVADQPVAAQGEKGLR